MSILKFIGVRTGGPSAAGGAGSADADSIRRIARELDGLEPERARHVASFAFLLSRVARSDLTISDEETRQMERLVAERTGLPEDQAVLVVAIAKHQNVLFGGTENFLVTRELKQTATREEKLDLLRCLFAVSAADDSISTTEEGTVAQIASELGIDRRDMVQVRAEFSDRRAVFKKRP